MIATPLFQHIFLEKLTYPDTATHPRLNRTHEGLTLSCEGGEEEGFIGDRTLVFTVTKGPEVQVGVRSIDAVVLSVDYIGPDGAPLVNVSASVSDPFSYLLDNGGSALVDHFTFFSNDESVDIDISPTDSLSNLSFLLPLALADPGHYTGTVSLHFPDADNGVLTFIPTLQIPVEFDVPSP